MPLFFFSRGVQTHERIFRAVRGRYTRIFSSERPQRRPTKSHFTNIEVNQYIDQINYLNQIVCDNRVTDMKVLESLGVDEYYQTINTWLRILEEKNEAIEKGGKGSDDDGKQRRKLGGK